MFERNKEKIKENLFNLKTELLKEIYNNLKNKINQNESLTYKQLNRYDSPKNI